MAESVKWSFGESGNRLKEDDPPCRPEVRMFRSFVLSLFLVCWTPPQTRGQIGAFDVLAGVDTIDAQVSVELDGDLAKHFDAETLEGELAQVFGEALEREGVALSITAFNLLLFHLHCGMQAQVVCCGQRLTLQERATFRRRTGWVLTYFRDAIYAVGLDRFRGVLKEEFQASASEFLDDYRAGNPKGG